MAKKDLFKEALDKGLIEADSKEKDYTVNELEELIKNPPKLENDPKVKIEEESKEVDYKKLYEDLEAKTKEVDVTSKDFSNTSNESIKESKPDIVLKGVTTNNWRLLCKAFSAKEGWMKSTKALDLNTREVLVQTTTQITNPDGTYAIAETLTTVSGNLVKSEEDDIWMISQ